MFSFIRTEVCQSAPRSPRPLRNQILTLADMTKEALLATLDQLKDQEFKRFKWFLRDDRIPKDLVIAKNKLQDAGRSDTVDLMIEVFTMEVVVELAQEILSKIQRNDLAQSLGDRVNEEDSD